MTPRGLLFIWTRYVFSDPFLNVNKFYIVVCFCQNNMCLFLLICFIVHVSKISDKTDKFSLNYSNLFWHVQCSSIRIFFLHKAYLIFNNNNNNNSNNDSFLVTRIDYFSFLF